MRRPSPTTRLLAGAAVALAVLLGTLGTGGPATAQGFGERITAYDVQLTVEASGDLRVVETIAYDFGSNERRGILRFLPVRFPYDGPEVEDGRYERVYPVEDVSVSTSEGAPDDLAVTEEGDSLQMRVGDPDTFITGQHTYELSYTVRGALNGFDDHDELFWNVVGNQWDVPIESVSVDVALPGRPTEVACFAGPFGSTLPCDQAASGEGDRAAFADAGLAPRESMTVVVGFPTGLVADVDPVLEELWSAGRAFALTPVTGGLASVLGVAGIGGVGLLAWRVGRDRRYLGSAVDVAFGNDSGDHERVPLGGGDPSPVEFAPPDGLRPGQVGTLVDEVAHPLDVTATIVDLAVRGHLRIEEVGEDGWFSKQDWRMVALPKAVDDLHEYEQTLLRALFEDGDEVLLSDLKGTFAKHLGRVQDQLYADAVDNGWFPTRPDHVRALWVGLGVVAVIVGVVLTGVVAAFTTFGLVPVPLVVAGIVLLASAGKMPHRTPKGTGVLRRTLGFRHFIEESEKDRARFAERAGIFSEYLPYAIVFGATERWAKAFAGLDGQLPDTGGWYVGHGGGFGFHQVAFLSAMNGFTTTTAGTIAASPPTTGTSGGSGFGGGGFSGGGGGGGGGGSW